MNERMTEILDATCRVIARSGASGLRMSDVAAEAGVSSALVHYYFATREELLGQAFSYADARIEARTQAELARLPGAAAQLDYLLVVYAEADEPMREEWVIWQEAWRHALFNPEFREHVLEPYRLWVEQIASVVREGDADGSLSPRDDPDDVAARLTALVDGLGQQLLLGHVEPDRMRRLIRSAVAAECGIGLPETTA